MGDAMKSTCILVEDDVQLGRLLKADLERRGYLVNLVTSVSEAITCKVRPSCAIVDWNLPDGEGPHLVELWRKRGWLFPVLILTARTLVADKIHALNIGAADYLTKPFDPNELAARLQALMRLTSEASSQVISVADIELGPLVIHPTKNEVYWKKNPVTLAKLEFNLLLFLARYPNQVFTRDEILMRVWGDDVAVTNRTIDNHVLQLRKKLDPGLIETVWSTGYRLKILEYATIVIGFFTGILSIYKDLTTSFLRFFNIITIVSLMLLPSFIGSQSLQGQEITEDLDLLHKSTELALQGRSREALELIRNELWTFSPHDSSREKNLRELTHALLNETARKAELYPDEFLRLDTNQCNQELTGQDHSKATCQNGHWNGALTRTKSNPSEILEIHRVSAKEPNSDFVSKLAKPIVIKSQTCP